MFSPLRLTPKRDVFYDAGPTSAQLIDSSLVMRGETGKANGQRLLRDADARLQPVTVTVQAFDLPASADVPAVGQTNTAPRWQFGGPGIGGLPSCFATGRERSYLEDWDVEVASGARIADPKVGLCEDGWFATVKVLPNTEGTPRRVELAMDIVDFVALRQNEISIGAANIAADSANNVLLPRLLVTVEQAVTQSLQIGTVLDLDDNGVAVLRRSATKLFGAGRDLVVVVHVQ